MSQLFVAVHVPAAAAPAPLPSDRDAQPGPASGLGPAARTELHGLENERPALRAWVQSQVSRLAAQAQGSGQAPPIIVHAGHLGPLGDPSTPDPAFADLMLACPEGEFDDRGRPQLIAAVATFLRTMGRVQEPTIVFGRFHSASSARRADRHLLGAFDRIAAPRVAARLFVPDATTAPTASAAVGLTPRPALAPTPLGRRPWGTEHPERAPDMVLAQSHGAALRRATRPVAAPPQAYVIAGGEGPDTAVNGVGTRPGRYLGAHSLVNHLGSQFGLTVNAPTPGQDLVLPIPYAGAQGVHSLAQQVANAYGHHVDALVGSFEDGWWARFHPGAHQEPLIQPDPQDWTIGREGQQRVRVDWTALEAREGPDLTIGEAGGGKTLARFLAIPGSFAVCVEPAALHALDPADVARVIQSSAGWTDGQTIMMLPWPAEPLRPQHVAAVARAAGAPVLVADDPVWNDHGRAVMSDPVTVYRVEGPRSTRIEIDDQGGVTLRVTGSNARQTLWLNFGSERRARDFFQIRRQQPGGENRVVRSFDVPLAFADRIAEAAVPEPLAARFRESPVVGDPVQAPDQLGIRPEQFAELQGAIIQGSGRYAFGTRPPQPAGPGPASLVDLTQFGTPLEVREDRPRSILYEGMDGTLREVTFYPEPAQALARDLAARIYEDLGLPTLPRAVMPHGTEGIVVVPFPPDVAGRLGDRPLTAEGARQCLEGVAADALLKQWGRPLDLPVDVHGRILRDDRAASILLWRSMGARKREGLLEDMSELVNFFDYPANKSYSPIAHAAGYDSVFAMPDFSAQVDVIVALRAQWNGWAAYVQDRAPEMPAEETAAIVGMLEARTSALQAIAAEGPGALARLARAASTSAARETSVGPASRNHPKLDERGLPVRVLVWSDPTGPETWTDPRALAVFAPGSPTPAVLNGIVIAPWTGPATDEDWQRVDGQAPQLDSGLGSYAQAMRPRVGVIIVEPDGRLWLMEPTNHEPNGQVPLTFPQGPLPPGLSMQAAAIRIAHELTGLKVRITGVLGDYRPGNKSLFRYYIAERTGGSPADMGPRSQAGKLVPFPELETSLVTRRDLRILTDLQARR